MIDTNNIQHILLDKNKFGNSKEFLLQVFNPNLNESRSLCFALMYFYSLETKILNTKLLKDYFKLQHKVDGLKVFVDICEAMVELSLASKISPNSYKVTDESVIQAFDMMRETLNKQNVQDYIIKQNVPEDLKNNPPSTLDECVNILHQELDKVKEKVKDE